jgi:hypothetical protein
MRADMVALTPTANCTSSQLRRGLGMPKIMSKKAKTGAN